MRKSVLIIVPIILLVSMACSINLAGPELSRERGSGTRVSEQRDVSGFDQVEFGGIGDLTISQGDEESLTIEAADNIIDRIETRVSGGKLFIGLERNFNVTGLSDLNYTLVVKDLSRLELTGFGNIDIDQLKTGSLEIDLSGSGNLEIADLQADSLNVVISGFGNADVSGESPEVDVEIKGAGDFNAGDLRSQAATVAVSGFGNATLWVLDELDARISGTGNISYYGAPRVSQNVSGFGKLESLGSK